MIAIVAWVRRVPDSTRQALRAVSLRFGHRAPSEVEPELDRRARQFFDELKASQPFQPSRDLMEGVLQRLRDLERHDDPGKQG